MDSEVEGELKNVAEILRSAEKAIMAMDVTGHTREEREMLLCLAAYYEGFMPKAAVRGCFAALAESPQWAGDLQEQEAANA